MRIVAGPPWTVDGRWVVLAEWLGHVRIVCDPDNGSSWLDLGDCLAYVRETDDGRTRT